MQLLYSFLVCVMGAEIVKSSQALCDGYKEKKSHKIQMSSLCPASYKQSSANIHPTGTEENPNSLNHKELPSTTDGNFKFQKNTPSRTKRTPTGFSARGFHDKAFDRDFGHFSPVKKAEMKRDSGSNGAGFYGDTFSQGFGSFETMKRASEPSSRNLFNRYQGTIPIPVSALMKRRPEMDKLGFHGDVFSQGFGNFDTM